MATYQFTIPDEVAAQIAEAYAWQTGYTPTVLDDKGLPVANPKTPIDAWREATAAQWATTVNAYNEHKRVQAVQAALAEVQPVVITMDMDVEKIEQ